MAFSKAQMGGSALGQQPLTDGVFSVRRSYRHESSERQVRRDTMLDLFRHGEVPARGTDESGGGETPGGFAPARAHLEFAVVRNHHPKLRVKFTTEKGADKRRHSGSPELIHRCRSAVTGDQTSLAFVLPCNIMVW